MKGICSLKDVRRRQCPHVHAAGGDRPYHRALQGAFVLLLTLSSGMTIWGLQESLHVRVLMLDALLNAAAIPAASLAAAAALTRSGRQTIG
jgi:hypothetical protein